METTISTPPSQNLVKKPKVKSSFSLELTRFLFRTLGNIFPDAAFRIAWNKFTTPKRKRHIIWPDIFEKAQMLGIAHKDDRIRTYLWGYTGNIVLLVHGWASGSWAFQNHVPELVAAGYRVVAIDGPAHGESKQQRTNLVEFGDALKSVINFFDKSGGISFLVGHSFGGSTIAQMFTQYRFPQSLRGIILIAISARVDMIFKRYFDFLQLPEKVRQRFEENLENLFGLNLENLRLDNWKEAINITNILVIHDKQDKVIPFTEIEPLTDQWPQANFLFTDNLGHNRILKDKEVMGSIVSFIDDNNAEGR